jgi:hypothetical protein
MSETDIAALIDELAHHVEAIATADPETKADLYARLGLHLTYDPTQQTVRAEARLSPAPKAEYGEMVGVRGPSCPICTCPVITGELILGGRS